MPTNLRVGICQLNPVVGDIEGNTAAIAQAYNTAVDDGADLVVTPELSIVGYPPKDLLHRSTLLNAQQKSLAYLAEQTTDGPPLIVGAALRMTGKTGAPLRNTAVVLRDGEQPATYHKRLLPTYDVFDEARYFKPGDEAVIEDVNGVAVGLTVGEDARHDVTVTGQRRYGCNPFAETAAAGADVILALSADVFNLGKPRHREERFLEHAASTGCAVLFANQVGGNDELVFDGHSFVAGNGQVVDRLTGFESEVRVVEVPVAQTIHPNVDSYSATPVSEARDAIVLGVGDYFEKTGFDEVVVGLSGGIDSSVTAAIAVDALGRENVYGVSLPGRVTADESVDNAETVAANLGIEFDVIPIGTIVDEMVGVLGDYSAPVDGVPLENVQARVRGDMLMGIANQRDALVLAGNNKSERAVGYCTLYGDTVGAIAPLGDCYKELVYQLAAHFNQSPPEMSAAASSRGTGRVIPASVIEKAPSAELRPSQTDTDTLPAYEELDPILESYIDAAGKGSKHRGDVPLDSPVALETMQRVALNEFKRMQSPPSVRVTSKAFGRGWRYPVAAEYRHVVDKNYTTDYHTW